jgi:hypothetical protein
VPESSNKPKNCTISEEHEDPSWSVVPTLICLTLLVTSPRTNIAQEILFLDGLVPCSLNFAFMGWRRVAWPVTTLFRVRARACSRRATLILPTRFHDEPEIITYYSPAQKPRQVFCHQFWLGLQQRVGYQRNFSLISSIIL